MVDIALLQSVSYIAGALGVCVAAGYYIQNMRETVKNRRATITTTLLQSFLSEEGGLRLLDLLSMQWKDIDDFVKKYDSSINPQNYAKRFAFWNTCDMLGYQYRTGIIDLETIYDIGGQMIVTIWTKFKPIIEHYRGWEWSKDYLSNYEYLVGELLILQEGRDKNYREKFDVVLSTHPRDDK
jgi:hypothetical protein